MRFLVLGVLALAIIVPIFASAQLIPCGGPGQEACTLCHLFDLAKKIIDTLTTVIAPAIAVLAFTVGGFKILMSGPNPGLRSEGMKAIRNGVIGLLIVFGSWIIVSEFILFFVGSQNITSLAPWSQITCVPPLPPKTTTTTTTTAVSPGGRICTSNGDSITKEEIDGYAQSNNTNHAALLVAPALAVNRLCATFDEAVPANGSKATCTSVAYLPDYVIPKLKTIRSLSGSAITITGGTECGHQTHGFYNPNVDLRVTTELTNYIVMAGAAPGNQTILGTGKSCSKYILNTINTTFVYETPECAGTTAHWHVNLNP